MIHLAFLSFFFLFLFEQLAWSFQHCFHLFNVLMFLIQQNCHFHTSGHLRKSFIANEISVPIYCTQQIRYFLGLLNSHSEMWEGMGCGSGTLYSHWHCKKYAKNNPFSLNKSIWKKNKNSAVYLWMVSIV